MRLFDHISRALISRENLGADDRFLCRATDGHHLRSKQHVELGDNRSDQYRHYAGDIHLYIRHRFHRR